jgi:hypothetical protein
MLFGGGDTGGGSVENKPAAGNLSATQHPIDGT